MTGDSIRWQILQFTTHILDTQPVDRIRYRNRTRLKYHFHAINIDKELARLGDGRGGTTAVSGMSAPSFTHLGFAKLTGISVRKQVDTRSKPSCEWWADVDPFVHDASETVAAPREPSNTGRVFEPGAPAVPEQATRLSGETLVDKTRSWQSDDSAVRGQSANHKKWVRQKITEGGV
ncbi:Protein kinase, ATP binding site [Penicillium camemberti]|uniref:Protein kinase, ATP binding site n=1 Tax=Penicillium camemberti (strain FM 013) TaxID=1429867 RepID=A0A0G4PZ16_PENC3|nr:Protein kinase, ATP binding site [Penicillium camemberti]